LFIHIALYNQIPSFHHLPYCPEYILMLGILQSVHHIPEHPCHTIGIIGVILVNNGVCKPYSACIGRVNVLDFKLPADQIGSKVSAKASGIFKSEYNFLYPANLPYILNECRESGWPVFKVNLTQFISSNNQLQLHNVRPCAYQFQQSRCFVMINIYPLLFQCLHHSYRQPQFKSVRFD